MRIALLSVHTSPLARLGSKEAGGMNVYVYQSARELGRRGIQVDIYTRRQSRVTPTVHLVDEYVRVIQLPAGPAVPYDKNHILIYAPEFVRRVCCFAEHQNLFYDLIHSHYWVSGAIALVLRQHWGIPIIQMFHTLGAMKNTIARSAEETETDHRMAIERYLLHQVDHVVAATPVDQEQMRLHYRADPARIAVIPPGVDLHRFQPRSQRAARLRLGLDADQRLVLAVGAHRAAQGPGSSDPRALYPLSSLARMAPTGQCCADWRCARGTGDGLEQRAAPAGGAAPSDAPQCPCVVHRLTTPGNAA